MRNSSLTNICLKVITLITTKNSHTSDHMFVFNVLLIIIFQCAKVYSCFDDFQKAFDPVVHKICENEYL